jgi:hypothetical protein
MLRLSGFVAPKTCYTPDLMPASLTRVFVIAELGQRIGMQKRTCRYEVFRLY